LVRAYYLYMKDGFIIYKSLYEPIRDLTREEKGELLEAIFEYQQTSTIINMCPIVKMAFMFFKNQFDIDQKKYIDKCLKNKENANLRWNANASNGMRTEANHADKDKDKEKEKDKDKVKDKLVLNKFNTYTIEFSNKLALLFPENTRPKSDKQLNDWCDVVDKLTRLDGLTYEQIHELTNFARAHEFWSGQFLSLLKLRKKNKDGVPYHVVFAELLKTKSNGKSTKRTQWDALKEW